MLRSALILTCAKAAHAPVCASARMCAVGCAQAARSSTLADTLVLSNLVVVSSHLIYSTTHTHTYIRYSPTVLFTSCHEGDVNCVLGISGSSSSFTSFTDCSESLPHWNSRSTNKLSGLRSIGHQGACLNLFTWVYPMSFA